jgi:hypothetical protein
LLRQHFALAVLAVCLVGAELRPAAAQQPDPARLAAVTRALAALRPDIRLGTFRTFAAADLARGRRVAVVAGGQAPRRDDEWFPETWGLVLLDAQAPARVRVLDTLRANDMRAAIDYAAPDEVIVRREGVDYGENLIADQYRQYFFDPVTWAERGRRIYRAVAAATPVAVQDSVFAAVQIVPLPRAGTPYPSVLLAVPMAGGSPSVHRPPLDSIRWLEALGDSLVAMSDKRVWMRLTGTRRIPLPTPSWERFARTRPEPVAWNKLAPGDWLLHATVGPRVLVGDQLWFGLAFYDGEGMSGVGGLGVLDPASGRLRVRYPPAMAEWSVASLAAQDSVLWVGLVSYGEGSDVGGGLARYEIGTGRFVRYDVPGVISGILPLDGALYLAGERGLHVLRRGAAGDDILERVTVRLDRTGAPHMLEMRTLVRPRARVSRLE